MPILVAAPVPQRQSLLFQSAQRPTARRLAARLTVDWIIASLVSEQQAHDQQLPGSEKVVPMGPAACTDGFIGLVSWLDAPAGYVALRLPIGEAVAQQLEYRALSRRRSATVRCAVVAPRAHLAIGIQCRFPPSGCSTAAPERHHQAGDQIVAVFPEPQIAPDDLDRGRVSPVGRHPGGSLPTVPRRQQLSLHR